MESTLNAPARSSPIEPRIRRVFGRHGDVTPTERRALSQFGIKLLELLDDERPLPWAVVYGTLAELTPVLAPVRRPRRGPQ